MIDQQQDIQLPVFLW